MTWKVEWDDRARKELRKLDQQVQRAIFRYLREKIAVDDNPRRFGDELKHDFSGLWRYRISDYRLICRIDDSKITVFVVRVGHRRKVYE